VLSEQLNIQRQIWKLPYILSVVGAASDDRVLLSDTSDGGKLKMALVSSFPGGGGGGATNLSYDAPTRTVASDTGSDAVLTLADGTNAGLLASTDFTKLSFLSITQAVNLDTLESDTVLNNAKVSNATHTGEVTGSTVLTLDKTSLTGKVTVTADPLDYVLLSDTSDSGNLKKALVSDFGGSGTTNLAYDAPTRTVSSDTGSDAILTLVDSTNAGLMSSSDFSKLALITGTNTGDQTTIVGITGTKTQFDTALTDGNFLFVGDAPTAHTHVEADITDFGIYSTDIHSNITALNAVSGVNTGDQTSIVGVTGTKAEYNTSLTDGDFLFVGDVVSNVTHTGEVTGATVLTVDKTAITNKTSVVAATGDKILIADVSDSENLKYTTVQDIISLVPTGLTQSDVLKFASFRI
jgi:hypothetical protein